MSGGWLHECCWLQKRAAGLLAATAIEAELLSAGDHATGQIKRAGNPAPLLVTGARDSAGTFSSQVGCPRRRLDAELLPGLAAAQGLGKV